MNESDRRQRVISSTPRLTIDDVVNHAFARGVRGFSETEVRAFLKRVAEELAAARAREAELESAVDALEEQLRAPRPLTEQELLDALGDETARLLRSAREASDDIRRKAEERAAELVDEAIATASRTRADATEMLTARTNEAEARVSELVSAAETRAAGIVDAATAESEKAVDEARHQGREMLDEAKAARERVLHDLVRRRALLNGQIEALRGGRDRLLDAYRTVKRTFLEATESLAQVEARAAVERSSAPAETIDVAGEIAAEIEKLDAQAEAAAAGAPEVELVVEETVIVLPSEPAGDEAEVATALADVDTLFARLRAGHDEEPGADAGADAGATAVLPAVAAPDAAATATTTAGPAAAPESAPEPAPAAAKRESASSPVDAAAWRARRAKDIDALLTPLLKRAKRRAQDDQNALLDAVRRHKGRPSAQQVLGDADTARAEWVKVMRDAYDRAYSAGRAAAGGTPAPAADDAVGAAADTVVAPLRDRLTVAIDSGTEDPGGLVERIGARYREWKNQSLERALGEVLAAAWTRGVFDAVPDDAVLWWIPFEEGRCSDCDDNALEPTTKGAQFPTGQAFPPAHPGCMCLLAPAGAGPVT